jgi:hypothetical protein
MLSRGEEEKDGKSWPFKKQKGLLPPGEKGGFQKSH